MSTSAQEELHYDWLKVIYEKGWLTVEDILNMLRKTGEANVTYSELSRQIVKWQSNNLIEGEVLLTRNEPVYKVPFQVGFSLALYKKKRT